MKNFNYIITDELGIHARPAGLLVKEATKFESMISIKHGDKVGDAKRILNVMSMGIKKGNEIIVQIEGTDEDEAFTAIEVFFKCNL